MERTMKVAKFLWDELLAIAIVALITGGGVAIALQRSGVEPLLVPLLVGSLIGAIVGRALLWGLHMWIHWVVKMLSGEAPENPRYPRS